MKIIDYYDFSKSASLRSRGNSPSDEKRFTKVALALQHNEGYKRHLVKFAADLLKACDVLTNQRTPLTELYEKAASSPWTAKSEELLDSFKMSIAKTDREIREVTKLAAGPLTPLTILPAAAATHVPKTLTSLVALSLLTGGVGGGLAWALQRGAHDSKKSLHELKARRDSLRRVRANIERDLADRNLVGDENEEQEAAINRAIQEANDYA